MDLFHQILSTLIQSMFKMLYISQYGHPVHYWIHLEHMRDQSSRFSWDGDIISVTCGTHHDIHSSRVTEFKTRRTGLHKNTLIVATYGIKNIFRIHQLNRRSKSIYYSCRFLTSNFKVSSLLNDPIIIKRADLRTSIIQRGPHTCPWRVI